jgi:hypothetical protein
MADTRRTYRIEVSSTEPLPSIPRLVKEHMRTALQSDLVEVKRGSEIVAFGSAYDLTRREAPAETALESE